MQKRQFEIVAQDPSVRDRNGRVLTARISLPCEDLVQGPMGYAFYVVDYDASTGTMYQHEPPPPPAPVVAPKSLKKLLTDPDYHAMNAYAIAMRTLMRFEFSLGRRVGWSFNGHQLKVVPHAFEEANAFYSPDLEALLFGYVRDRQPTLLCLSHDIVAHETTHALLDGLRSRFMRPSSPDQAALHEAFADIVALLSVFALPEVVQHLISPIEDGDAPDGFARKSVLSWDRLMQTTLLGLAEDMRADAADVRVNALRRSVTIEPDPNILNSLEFQEEHRRGEVLVAAVMRAFLSAWVARIQRLGSNEADSFVDIGLAAEQGADIADVLLTMAIRAIDYTPPIHIRFGDFLSAMLTADSEVRADDTRYNLREHLRGAMGEYGIRPSSDSADGRWKPPSDKLARDGSHFGSLQTDPTEMFRLIWKNRDLLGLDESAFTRVASVRPCVRVSPEDGFQVRETVVECVQWLKVTAAELPGYRLKTPRGMPADQEVVLEAGSTLILDEYGELKFNVSNRLPPPSSRIAKDNWNRRLQYLWDEGYISGANRSSSLASFHLQRALTGKIDAASELEEKQLRAREGWT
jgi:Thermolysin metallopeptidase, catalytic domain